MNSDIASIEFLLEWRCRQALHRDRYFFPRINFWRDLLPQPLDSSIDQLLENGQWETEFPAGKLVEPFKAGKRHAFHRTRLKRDLADKSLPLGRFFPRGLISEIGFAKGDIRPFRVIGGDAKTLRVDTNHPLSAVDLKLRADLVEVLPDRHMRGGSSIDVAAVLTDNGPGMQAASSDVETDFSQGEPFLREDSDPDRIFYQSPRCVSHVDASASKRISEIYSRFIKPGMKVLDLMAGWNSHVDRSIADITVTGLGMNRQEQEENPTLSDIILHDLNSEGSLPFADRTFDIGICSLSVEYLVDPIAVFREVGRVLAPGAPFIVTFSDRWFDTKVIRVWTELHPFERIALVMDYFQRSNCFMNIHTESIRGYPRPTSDRHIHERRDSDPVFAVWGYQEM